MIIRKASPADVNVLAEMNRKFQISEKKISDKYLRVMALKELKKRISNHIKKNNMIFLIAEKDGQPVGFCKGIIESYKEDYEGLDKIGFISIIYVEKPYRRQGIGSKLSKKMTEEFKKKRVTVITIFNYASNKAAVAFAKKRGYKIYSYELRKFLKKA